MQLSFIAHLARKIQPERRLQGSIARLRAIEPVLWLSILTTLISCGGVGTNSGKIPLSVAPSIITQPTSQTMLLGRGSTFSVTATGTAPLLYQWYRNGATISGANEASYTSPVVKEADNNTVYSVTVSNSAGYVKSNPATLLAGPRAPAIGDLRYLQWEQVPLAADIGSQYGGLASIIGIAFYSAQNVVAYPLNVGSHSVSVSTQPCSWEAISAGIKPGTQVEPFLVQFSFGNVGYRSGQTYQQYLLSIANSNSVVISMDYHPTCQEIGVVILSATSNATPAFDQRMELVDPSNLQAQVAADGAASRIVSAITYDRLSGKAVLLSYGWQGDAATAYEAKTFIAQPADVLADAAQLANQGYFISAFGGDDTLGYMIVGMRVMGDATPRPWYGVYGIDHTSTATNGNVPSIPNPAPATTNLWLEEGTPGAPSYSLFEQ